MSISDNMQDSPQFMLIKTRAQSSWQWKDLQGRNYGTARQLQPPLCLRTLWLQQGLKHGLWWQGRGCDWISRDMPGVSTFPLQPIPAGFLWGPHCTLKLSSCGIILEGGSSSKKHFLFSPGWMPEEHSWSNCNVEIQCYQIRILHTLNSAASVVNPFCIHFAPLWMTMEVASPWKNQAPRYLKFTVMLDGMSFFTWIGV